MIPFLPNYIDLNSKIPPSTSEYRNVLTVNLTVKPMPRVRNILYHQHAEYTPLIHTCILRPATQFQSLMRSVITLRLESRTLQWAMGVLLLHH